MAASVDLSRRNGKAVEHRAEAPWFSHTVIWSCSLQATGKRRAGSRVMVSPASVSSRLTMLRVRESVG